MSNNNTIDYNTELVIVVTESNKDTVIRNFCESLFENNINSVSYSNDVALKNSDEYYNHEALANILHQLPKPFTIVQEFHHIDRCFRDTYYMYFSNQHFDMDRYSRRLSFFYGEFSFDSFFSADKEVDTSLKRSFMGSCVINPSTIGAIGRTLIDPKYLKISQFSKYMRLSDFKLHVLGKEFHVHAFPYRMQDAEAICCAEVTLLNILEYYGNSFGDYKYVLPSEIISNKKFYNHERVLPTKGMTYTVLTKILSELGFYPRLYNVSSISGVSLSKFGPNDEIKKWLHYYIESGIPVAVNLSPLGGGSCHSVVCIGHGSRKNNYLEYAKRKKIISWQSKENCHAIINSADFYDDYIIVDDNMPIYQLKNFEELSSYPNMKVSDISVPLYRRMFLDAPDASAIFLALLHDSVYGISNWTEDHLDPNEDVVIRLFMASSHSLKSYRAKTIEEMETQKLYITLPMPRFVWVCELYRVSDYDDLKAFGEIVIDATSASNSAAKSIIIMHYFDKIIFRTPDQKDINYEQMLTEKNKETFLGYRKNLDEI